MNRGQSLALASIFVSMGGLFLWFSHTAPASAHVSAPAASAATPVEEGDTLDIVFALDTTASMTGLLGGAKAKIWEIARGARTDRPNANLRIGLVAYRDVSDEYVTSVLELTGNLDKVYRGLAELTAQGGGDAPEHVIKGLSDAIHGQPWSARTNATKLIYLVGDAPPHLDYHDGLTMDGVLTAAQAKGIRIHAIRCGNDEKTLSQWSRIALATHGETMSIAASGGVVVTSTPFDDEMVRLNAALAATELHYGSAMERAAAQEELRSGLSAPAQIQADRASYFGADVGSIGARAKKDLVASPSSLNSLSSDELPPELKGMDSSGREAFLASKQRERERILAQIRSVAEKRQQFLEGTAVKDSEFDGKVKATLSPKSAQKGSKGK